MLVLQQMSICFLKRFLDRNPFWYNAHPPSFSLRSNLLHSSDATDHNYRFGVKCVTLPLDGQKYWPDAILGMHEIPQSHNQNQDQETSNTWKDYLANGRHL